MATTLTISSATPLLNGAGSGQRGYVGVLGGNWVMQYKFTTPSAGYVTGLTFRSYWYHTAGFNFASYPVRAYVTTSATSHVNAGSTSAYHASMYAESTGGYNVAVSINDLQLSPSTTYYLYLFAGYTSSYRYSAHNYSAGQTNNLEATVAMESELSAGNGTLGTSQILKVTQKSASYTHTITYSCGTASGTICTKSKSTSVNWTPPLALATQNTTGTTVSVTLTVTTYNGDSVIGSKSVTITCAIPSSVKPQVADGWAKAAVYNIGTKAEDMPLFVQGYSKAQVTFDESLIDLSGAYGAEIASYKIVHNGTAVTASPFRTGVMKTAGEHTITCYVYDTRGRYGSATLSVTVQPYANPILSGVSVYRSDSLGDETDEGTYISVIAAPTISSVDGLNGSTLQVRYGANGSNYGAYQDLAPNTLTQIGDGAVLTTQSYMVEILLTDLMGNTAVYTQLVPTAEAFFHGRAGGGGAAFGKYSEEDDLLDVGWKIRGRKNLDVDGNAAVGGELTAEGDASVGGKLTAEGDASVVGALTVGGTLNVGNNLNVSGTMNATGYGLKTYYNPTHFGSAYDATMSDLFNALPSNSIFMLEAGALTGTGWNFPTVYGTVVIFKRGISRSKTFLYGKSGSNSNYYSEVNDQGVPTGVWYRFFDSASSLLTTHRTASATVAKNGTAALISSIIGKKIVFAQINNSIAVGKVIGSSGSYSIVFNVLDEVSADYTSYRAEKFTVSNDGKTLTLAQTRVVDIKNSGNSTTVNNNERSVSLGAVYSLN